METSSGVDKKSATKKVLNQLDQEYTTHEARAMGANQTKGWSALALKNYCEERVLERNTTAGVRASSPVLQDF